MPYASDVPILPRWEMQKGHSIPKSYNFGEMNLDAFQASLQQDRPPATLTAPVQALWWDAKGDWSRAHELVDHLESPDGMAVHAYLHRKEGEQWNADYWYRRAGRSFHRPQLEEEWLALAEGLLHATRK